MNSKYILSVIFLVFSTFFWGTTFVLVKKTVSIIPIDGFLAVRFILAATLQLALLAISSPSELKDLKNPKVLKYGTLLGTLLYLSFIFQTIGLSLTTPSKAAFITGMNVLLVPIAAALPPYRRGITQRDLILAVIAFAGLGLMTLDFGSLSIEIGDAIIILTAIAIAYHIIVTEDAVKAPILPMLTIQLYVVGILSLLVGGVRGKIWNPFIGSYPQIVWITVIITSLFATTFAMWAQTFAQKNEIRGAMIALIFTLEPIFALGIDIMLGSIPDTVVFVGMMIILMVTIYSMYVQSEN